MEEEGIRIRGKRSHRTAGGFVKITIAAVQCYAMTLESKHVDLDFRSAYNVTTCAGCGPGWSVGWGVDHKPRRGHGLADHSIDPCRGS